MTGGGDAPWGATAQAQKRTTKVLTSNANPTIIKTDLNPGYGKRTALSVFSSPLSDPRSRRVNHRENERQHL